MKRMIILNADKLPLDHFHRQVWPLLANTYFKKIKRAFYNDRSISNEHINEFFDILRRSKETNKWFMEFISSPKRQKDTFLFEILDRLPIDLIKEL